MNAKSEPETPPKLIIPWRTRLAVSLITVMSSAARRSDGTINRRLLNFLEMKSVPSPHKPIHSVLSSDVTVDPSRNLWFRLYTPAASSAAAGCCGSAPNSGDSSSSPDVAERKLPVMIFFHGGGFCYLSAATKAYDVVCRRFSRRLNAVVVSVDYRLAPEHRFPSQYDDGFDVLKFLDDNLCSALPPNADLSRCILAGDSAGGNLAHHVAVRASRTQFRVARVVGLVSIQPYFGGEERTESELRLTGVPIVSVAGSDWAWKSFLPKGSDRDHYAVNVSGPNAEDISGLDYPETVVFVGGFDPLQDWQRKYYEWIKKSGKEVTLIEYPNMFHAFYIFPEVPESSKLFQQVQDFVAKLMSKL